jgi:hypothetical protein
MTISGEVGGDDALYLDDLQVGSASPAKRHGSRRDFRATVELRDDGTARIACGTQDIGTGTPAQHPPVRVHPMASLRPIHIISCWHSF